MTININCEACGKVYSVKIESVGQTFVCQACGSVCVVPSGNQPMDPDPVGTQPGKALAIVSLVLSIISVAIGLLGCLLGFLLGMGFPPFCFAPFMSSPLALVGAITGFIGLKKVKAGTASGKGLAMGGMITGIVVIVLNIIIAVLYILIIILFVGLTMLELQEAVHQQSNNY